jgi:hypothetical protein
MGLGPNYGLNKGYLATGATAYAFGEICREIANPAASLSSVANAVVRQTTAIATGSAATTLVVCQENLDTVKLGTGKAIISCAKAGAVRVLAGAAVTKGDRVTSDNTARAVTVTKATAGAIPVQVLGIAETDATAAGQFIDVTLTPGGVW